MNIFKKSCSLKTASKPDPSKLRGKDCAKEEGWLSVLRLVDFLCVYQDGHWTAWR